jgi:hypothetical protein
MAYEVLYNFISPVTGRILCDPTMVLVGDARGIAIPSPFIPIGALPDLPMGNIWIGNDMNRPIPSPIITIDNLPNLTAGKIWVGDALTNRPIESTIPAGPQGPAGPPGPAGSEEPNNLANDVIGQSASSLVSYGLQHLFGGVAGFGSTLLGGTLGTVGVGGVWQIFSGLGTALNKIGDGDLGNFDRLETEIDKRIKINARRNSQILPLGAGAPTASDKNIIYYFADMSLGGGRVENIAPSPLADYDAVNAKWVWDLLNDNVEIIFGEQLN